MQTTIRSICISALSAALLMGWAGEAAAQVMRDATCVHWGGGHVVTYDQRKYNTYDADFFLMADHQLSDAARFRTEIRKFKPTPNYQVAPGNGAATRCGDYVLKATVDDGFAVALNGMPIDEGSEFHFGPDNAYHLAYTGNLARLNCPDPQNPDLWSRVEVRLFDDYQGVGGYVDTRTFTSFYTPGEETTGICGPYNQDQSDDFTILQDLLNQYRLEESASLFAPQFYDNPEPPIYAEPRELEFDGQTSHLIDGQYALSPQFYVRVHVRVDASEQWNHIVELGALEHEFHAPLRIEVGEEGEWYIAVGDGQNYKALSKRGSWTYGEWVLLEVEYKGGAIRLWENGEYLGVEQADLQVDSVSGQLNIGSFARGGRYFKGALRNLQIGAIE